MIPSFVDQVRAAIAEERRRGKALLLGKTPAVLRMLDFPALPLQMPAGVLFKIYTGKNGERIPVRDRDLERLPELMDEPIAVFSSSTVQGALVVLAREADHGALVACVEANVIVANAAANVVTSVYYKERNAWAEREAADGRLRYADKIKGLRLLEVSGHTLNCTAEPGHRNPSTANIRLCDDLRNYRKMCAAEAFSLAK